MKKKQKNVTLDEAKKDIFRRVQRGESYREIVKTRYTIDDRTKRFSISEISKIKQEFTGQASNSKNKDPDMAFLFKEFDKEESLTDIVIKTQLGPDLVKQAHDKYLEFRDKRMIRGWFEDKIYEFGSRIKGEEVPDLGEIHDYLQEAVDHYLKPRLTFPCCICKELIELDIKAWNAARQYLVMKRWGHSDCVDNYNQQSHLIDNDLLFAY